MATVYLFVVFFLSRVLLLHSAEEERGSNCPHDFYCGQLGKMRFPFYSSNINSTCGLILTDTVLRDHINSKNYCNIFDNYLTLPSSPWFSFAVNKSLSLFVCNRTQHAEFPEGFNYATCKDHRIYYGDVQNNSTQSFSSQCSGILLPVNEELRKCGSLSKCLNATFFVDVKIPPHCYGCHFSGGQCQINRQGDYECAGSRRHNMKGHDYGWKIATCTAAVFFVVIVLFAVFMLPRYRKIKSLSSQLFSRSTSYHSKKLDLEAGRVYFGVPIFSYSELEEATNNFANDKLLGDGGFGTVYHGKLRDGREVAVKRLYEHNYRRVEQFMNEVEILTCLHHKNLVSLYGCTSRHSQELLLVYEFISKGTVADHLHGDQANPSSLTWPTRMNIAIETASALTYLHASDIIHRDVKTTNILLDDNFTVKVADFGLSRLFPSDVTHISTAPQGTPGYVDPQYHQCYQLTDKSDVYSFGVVLVELISSLPPVDITRNRNEVNLSNLAVNKIQNCEFEELIDPNLGYESDEEVRRMTTLVAVLAFKCLQQDPEIRPTMEEVLDELKKIQSGECKLENAETRQDEPQLMKNKEAPPSPPDSDKVALLMKIKFPSSPNSVTEKWFSTDTTPNTSG